MKKINASKISYSGVDIFKLFFAVCVVAIHAQGLDFLPEIVDYMVTKFIFRLAVPYFFVASGFFLGKKLNNESAECYGETIKKYCFRLLKPLIFFEIISLIMYGVKFFAEGKSLVNIILLLTRSALFYPYGALWYVQASIIGAILLYPF